MLQNLSSAAVVIGALRANNSPFRKKYMKLPDPLKHEVID